MTKKKGFQEIVPSDFPDVRWQGKWIWIPEEKEVNSEKDHNVLFRKTFTLDQIPDKIPARITADSRYILWINGVEVNRGPVRSQPRRLHYDYFNLANYVQTGTNTIAVRVRYYGEDTSWWMKTPNSYLSKSGVLVFEARLGEQKWLISDQSWKVLVSKAWEPVSLKNNTLAPAPLESFNASKLSANWYQRDFDDSNWLQAAELYPVHTGSEGRKTPPSDTYGPMYPRPIPWLEGATRQSQIHSLSIIKNAEANNPDPVNNVNNHAFATPAQTITTNDFPLTIQLPDEGNVLLIVDFGEEVSGFVKLDVQAQEGTVFDFAGNETLDLISSIMQHTGFRYITRGQQDCFTSFDTIGLRYGKIVISNICSEVTINNIEVCEHLYPVKNRGFFKSSNEKLNEIYEAGMRTVSLTAHDAYLDCPTREQRAWVGDSVVHQMVHLATNTDWKLAQWNVILGDSLRSDGILHMSVAGEMESQDNMANIPEWSLHWIHALYNLYWYQGDEKLIRKLLPTAEKILQWFLPYRNQDGLITDVPGWILVDWSNVQLKGTNSFLNAHWAMELKEFAQMATWLDDRGRVEWAQNLWQEIKDTFDKFWDENRQVYVDNIENGKQGKAMHQLAQAIPICAGLVPEDRLPILLENMTDREKLTNSCWLTDMMKQMQSMDPEQLTNTDQNEGMGEAMMQFSNMPPSWNLETESVKAEPFMQYMVHDAIYQAGGAHLIPDLCEDWSVFLKDGYKTFGELWEGGTHCHGWSSTPVKDLIFYTLGVTPAEPGFTKARVAPRLGSLEWVEGTVPTPAGFIYVKADHDEIKIKSPVTVILDKKTGETKTLKPGQHLVKY